MARDKTKDDKFFNCSEEHEFEYVSGLYDAYAEVYSFLKDSCENNTIKYSTHTEVYELIESHLGYTIPN